MARVGTVGIVLVVVGVLSGCGGSASDSSSDSGEAGPVQVTVTEQDGTIEASKTVVEAQTGQKIVLVVDSDAKDEIHVHSSPEHSFRVKPGEDQRFSFSLQTPGTYEVESHGLDVTILKIEVR